MDLVYFGPNAPVPSLRDSGEELDALVSFVSYLRENFYSSPTQERELEFLSNVEQGLKAGKSSFARRILPQLRFFFGNRDWTALLIPSTENKTHRDYVCSRDLLKKLVSLILGAPALILQLEEASTGIFTLTDVFPAFRTALKNVASWPGILVWTRKGDSAFFPFPSDSPRDVDNSAVWIMTQLTQSLGLDLERLISTYSKNFPSAQSDTGSRMSLIQISDLHIGSNEASNRLARVAGLIRGVAAELDGSSRVVPVITGDLMDTPSKRNTNEVQMFLEFLSQLGTEAPILVLGNHDVRRNGFLTPTFASAFKNFDRGVGVHWFDNPRVGIVCFNSVFEGTLARGYVGEEQLLQIGTALDRKKTASQYALVGVLHHHPVPVEIPDWYLRPFYEKILGNVFEETEILKDSKQFLEFVEKRRMVAILHGHKHIPRIAMSAGRIPIYGCGSTVGKVKVAQPGTYMSINVVTIDTNKGRISGRLLAERIPGGGLIESKRHEIVYARTF